MPVQEQGFAHRHNTLGISGEDNSTEKAYSFSEDSMRSNWALRATILFSFFIVQGSIAHAQQQGSAVPTIRVSSQLVFLDVTVLGRDGHPVTKGLTKDDFSITDDKRPQRIFSFEPPESHVVSAGAPENDPAVEAPLTIFVLDLLNSRFEDFAYIRYRVHKYLTAQPEQLDSPAELLVLGNDSLEVAQGFTRNRADLLYALDHVPTAIPYKIQGISFLLERFIESIDSLQQIALQNAGVPGRKNIIWVGRGGPSLFPENLAGGEENFMRYMRETTNQLVDSRISLYVIYPGIDSGDLASQVGSQIQIGEQNPFAGGINFGVLVQQTGGKLFYQRNDVDREMTQALELGREYYTLTYQPSEGNADGRFRRISVALRDPNLRVVTKTGYFAPDKDALPGGSREQTLVKMSEAEHATIPFSALDVSIGDVVRHPDTGTVAFTVLLRSPNIGWQPEPQGKSSVEFFLAAASLNRQRSFLSSHFESLDVMAPDQDPDRLAKTLLRVPVTLRTPAKMQSVRVIVQTTEGRMGSVELDRKQIAAAPETPTPAPQLMSRPQMHDVPTQP